MHVVHNIVLLLFVVLGVQVGRSVSAMAEQPGSFPPEFVAQLSQAKEIYVATDRKDGKRSEAVPVWFGYMDNALWFTTSPDSNKAKRVKRGSPIYVSTQGKNGPYIKTQAEIIKDGALADKLGEIYSEKYWIAWVGFFRPSRS